MGGPHDGRIASAGSPGGMSQTFEMGADGLDGVWLRPLIVGGAPRGELLVDLLQVQGETRRRLLRVAVPATGRRSGVALHVPFRPIRASRGVTYQVDVRHVHMAGGPAIDLAVTREDACARDACSSTAVSSGVISCSRPRRAAPRFRTGCTKCCALAGMGAGLADRRAGYC